MTHYNSSSPHHTGEMGKNPIHVIPITQSQHCRVQISKDELGIFLLLKGRLHFQSRHQLYQMSEGDGLIVNQFGFPEFSPQRETIEGVLIKIGFETIRKLLSTIKYKSPEVPVVVTLNQLLLPKSEGISLFLESVRFYTHSANSFFSDSICETKLLELFWILNSSDVKSDFDRLIYPFLVPERSFLDSIMERYYKENLGLSQLASLAGYSVSTFKRKFEETYQCSPGRWVQNRRLMEAKFLLEVTNKTIHDIGYEVGFESPSHFIQAFKMKFGITPKRLQLSKNAA